MQKTLGRYEIVTKLGEGGMASVYLGRDAKLARDVAIKVLPAWCRNDAAHLGRFRREVKLLAGITHPHIVSVYDFGEDGPTVFYAMEYLPGGSLAGELGRKTRLPIDRLLKLAREMIAALECIHKLGIVHRDLKPQNILRSEAGTYKLADFGLGKEQDGESITQVGELIGTIRYLPPEGLEGRPMDVTSDIFQLGVVLYEAATGARPWRGSSTMELLHSFRRDVPAPPSTLISDLPPIIDMLILNMIELLPPNRYPSVAPLLADLHRVERNIPIRSRKDGGGSRGGGSTVVAVPTPVRTTPWPAGVLAAMGFTLLLLLMVFRPGRTPGTSGPAPEPIASLSVRTGQARAVLTWTSRAVYRGKAEYGKEGSGVLAVVEEDVARQLHELVLPDLEPGATYGFTVRPPGTEDLAQRGRLTPRSFSASLERASCSGGSGELVWTTSQAARDIVMVERFGQSDRRELPSQAATRHRVKYSGLGPLADFRLRVDSRNDVGELARVDVNPQVEALATRLSQVLTEAEVERVGRKLGGLMRKGTTGLTLARAFLEASDFMAPLAAMVPVVSYYVANPAYGLELRLSMVKRLRGLEAIGASVPGRMQSPLHVTWQLPEEFRTGTSSTVSGGVSVPVPVRATDWLVPDDPLMTGLDVQLAKSVRNRTAKVTVVVRVPRGEWQAAELAMRGRWQGTHLLEVRPAGRAGVVMAVPPGIGDREVTALYQRIPVGLLREGENRLEFAVSFVPGLASDPRAVTQLVSAELNLAPAPARNVRKLKVWAVEE